MRVGCFVVALLLCTALSTAVPIGKQQMEEVLGQMKLLQQDSSFVQTPSVINPIKEKVQKDIGSIRMMDDSDLANLVDEIASWKDKIASLEIQINETQSRQTELNATLDTLHTQCDTTAQTMSSYSTDVETYIARLSEHDAVVVSEELKYNDSITAINNDLEMLVRVEKELADAVKEKADAAGFESQPLEHQANTLVGGMRSEMLQTREKTEIEWGFTQKRLNNESQPIRDALESARHHEVETGKDLEQCHLAINSTEAEIQNVLNKVVELNKEHSNAETGLAHVHPAFEARHQARVKRISFLTNLLDQIDQIASDSAATTPSSAATTPSSAATTTEAATPALVPSTA